jgi:FtsP/CotA-like multicopper oxidase with cupredoxin domain
MPRQSADKEIYLYGHQARTSDGLDMRWLMNNASLNKLNLSNLTNHLLIDVYNRNDKTLPYDVTYFVGKNQLIDIVLQNTFAIGGVCESHPFHLHGHKFWVHSQGEGLYNSSIKLTHFSK